jgi:hypothetical protein
MSQLFQRIAQWIANDLVTKRLARSKTFIDAAHKTHTHVTKAQKHLDELAKDGGKSAAAQKQEISNFFKDFAEGMKEQIGGGGKK